MGCDRDPLHLHPLLRAKLKDLDFELGQANVPLRLYEGARTPWRQAELYSIGRVQGPGFGTYGKHVTRALAWESFHPFGCATDYVFNINGKWTWEEPRPGLWDFYTKMVRSLGLRTLSFEKPHLELPVQLSQLQAGHFPPGGDDTWEAWLEDQILRWGQSARVINGITHPAAPPILNLLERPSLVS